MSVDDQKTIPLTTLQVRVFLRGAQMADPRLTSALEMFRRASNVLARLEDAIVFRGQQARIRDRLMMRSKVLRRSGPSEAEKMSGGLLGKLLRELTLEKRRRMETASTSGQHLVQQGVRKNWETRRQRSFRPVRCCPRPDPIRRRPDG